MTQARRVSALIKYDNKDISADLMPYVKNISYRDAMSGQADDLQLTLEDRQGLWQSAWMPELGATLDVSLVTENWQDAGTLPQALRLGTFELDEITSTGYPSEAQLKAVSVPFNNTLRGEEHTRSWEKAELKTIANDIATAAGLELFLIPTIIQPLKGQSRQNSLICLFYWRCAAIMGWRLKSAAASL